MDSRIKVTYPPDELIDSYETLELTGETLNTGIYTAPDNDFFVASVVIDKQYLREGEKLPRFLIVSTAGEYLPEETEK